MGQKEILAILVDRDQLQTGGVRYAREGVEALKKEFDVTIKEWGADFGPAKKSKILGGIKICKWLTIEKPDIFYADSRMFSIVWFAVLYAGLLNIPFVTTVQDRYHYTGGTRWHGIQGWMKLKLLKLVCSRASLLIANSSVIMQVSNDFYGAKKENIIIINPGFDSDMFETPKISELKDISASGNQNRTDEVRIICLGRHLWAKGIDVLISALGSNKLSVPYRAILAGDSVKGAECEEFSRRIRELAAGLNIELLGKVDKKGVYCLYNWADLLVVPSRYEGFGIVVLEALWNGSMLIVSDALPVEVRNLSDRIVTFKSEDSDDLALKIMQVVNDCMEQRGQTRKPLIKKTDWNWERFRSEFVRSFLNLEDIK